MYLLEPVQTVFLDFPTEYDFLDFPTEYDLLLERVEYDFEVDFVDFLYTFDLRFGLVLALGRYFHDFVVILTPSVVVLA